MKISVVIPVYNKEKYMDDLFQCLLSQTFEEFECILIDDGSTDASGEISTFERIYDQDNTVYHLQDTFYFAAEVRMTWSVDDVDLGIFVINSCIFGKNRDTTFPLDIVGVHNTFLDFLIRTEYAALTK